MASTLHVASTYQINLEGNWLASPNRLAFKRSLRTLQDEHDLDFGDDFDCSWDVWDVWDIPATQQNIKIIQDYIKELNQNPDAVHKEFSNNNGGDPVTNKYIADMWTAILKLYDHKYGYIHLEWF
jgi:hypothetical protein